MGFLDERCLFQELTDEKIAASKPFYCGNNDLDEFFHEDVTKFSYNLMGKSYCFVLEEDPSIIGKMDAMAVILTLLILFNI